MTEDKFEKGAASAVLHFVFGAIAGAIIFGFTAWLFIPSPVGFYVMAGGSAFLGIAAAIWRGRFWAALGNNPVFRFWRTLAGSKYR